MSIKSARDAYREAQPGAREDAERLFTERMEPYRQALDEEVVQEYGCGASISQLCREYGTTARTTITDILKAHGVYEAGTYHGTRR